MLSSLPTLYLSGPMSGIVEMNRPAFYDAAKELAHVGFEVVNPADVDSTFACEGWGYAEFLRAALALQLGLDHEARFYDAPRLPASPSALCQLPGWSGSRGAVVEHSVAVALGWKVGTLESWRMYAALR